MTENSIFNLSEISDDPKDAIRNVTEKLFEGICPLMLGVRKKLQKYEGPLGEVEISKLQDVYSLCISQIKKCLQALFDVFKSEYRDHVLLQESRHCIIERLSWCINKLYSIEDKLEDCDKNLAGTLDDSVLTPPMYFVNWIDHTYDILSKLSVLIYRTDYKRSETLHKQWKNDLLECVKSLHLSLDELLLSAMTLCRYCLPTDQRIVKARCQVVLRETKALLNELIEGDLDGAVRVTMDVLKLPIMPSNVNVLIDVLKDVLYALETNTNTALLTLVVHCFSYNIVPVDVLKNHFMNADGTCICHLKNDGEITEDCSFVKDFDLYNERLLQIGSFAVSCSSDQNRILTLRSGLASLEALDPHLVPALMLSPDSPHASLLVRSWRQEVVEIRDSIFLIVDPAAFAEKTKQMLHQILIELTKHSVYDNSRVCAAINIGSVVVDFFAVYKRLEPDALTRQEELVPLLDNLDKVQMECKVVSNLLSSRDDFVYTVKKIKDNREVSVEQLLKRLKLLYTLISKINSLLHPKENEEFYDCAIDEETTNKNNITHTVVRKNGITYVQSPRKAFNISRSIFARTNTRSSTNKFPVQQLTKHLQAKKRDGLSFSMQLDEIFNLSEVKGTAEKKFIPKQLEGIREPSILYNFSPRKRNSLRKAVLNKQCKLPFDPEVCGNVEKVETSKRSDKGCLMDEATSLQITDILNQMSDMTNPFSRERNLNTTFTQPQSNQNDANQETTSNILSLNVNNAVNTTMAISKHIWKIPVNSSSVDIPLDDTSDTLSSNISAPSNITTLERINDIDLVESKLNNLKTELETSL